LGVIDFDLGIEEFDGDDAVLAGPFEVERRAEFGVVESGCVVCGGVVGVVGWGHVDGVEV
jgi:hypothetical protein